MTDIYWEEETKDEVNFDVPTDILDLSFKIQCKQLPLDHAHALSQALFSALPWLEQEPDAGIHLIHVAESGNGWMRPEGPNDFINPSRRTRLTLRLPSERIHDAEKLVGHTLDIDGNLLTLGQTSIRKLSSLTTLFTRYLAMDTAEDETAFLDTARIRLKEMNIRVKKMLCGRMHTHNTPQQAVLSRSLMLDGMEILHSIQLQEQGLGPHRKLGCGLFIPHKGIEAVKTAQ